MGQKYETIEVTDWRKLKTGYGINGLHVGRVVTAPGPVQRGVEIGGEFFAGPQAIVMLGACNYTVERPVAEEPKMDTGKRTVLDLREGLGAYVHVGPMFDWDQEVYVTVTEKPHTAVMGKVLGECPVDGSWAMPLELAGDISKAGVGYCKIIVIDESAEAE